MPNIENFEKPLKERIITAKDGIYLKIASDIYARMINDAKINSKTSHEEVRAILAGMAYTACEATEILIREVNSRIVGYKGDSFRDE